MGDTARSLNRWSETSGQEVPVKWRRSSNNINRSDHDAAVISEEFLCWLGDAQIRQILSSLSDSQVKVVLTTRHLARLIPAQWQSAMRHGKTWTLTQDSHAVAGLTADHVKESSSEKTEVRRKDRGPVRRRLRDAASRTLRSI
ncbi:MAG: hypothetical protein LH645_01240 [Actinomycetia bacterium]|nr:hypothetical protein [Actinomycetes bacterium]